METYRTIVGTLEGIAWLLLVCVFAALIAPMILRMAKLEPAKNRRRAAKTSRIQSSVADAS